MELLKKQHTYFKEVVERCNEQLQKDSENKEFLRLRGIALNIIELYDDAIKDLTKVIGKDDTDESTFFFRADSYLNTGLPDLAKRDYIEGIKIQSIDNTEVLKGYTKQVISKTTIGTEEELESIRKLLHHEKLRVLANYFPSMNTKILND
jgi:tetratricopeptide (TPR) repeat protein